LKSYVGFFTLLWLTWFAVSLYDVRFSADSIFERAAKALHFGVMVGFAVIGPSWKPSGKGYNFEYYRALSLILMASRFVLAAQYAVTLWFTRVHKKTRAPLIAIIVLTTCAAVIYGALTTTFSDVTCAQVLYYIGACPMLESRAYRGWYVVGIAEVMSK
jgi:amino acid transporter